MGGFMINIYDSCLRCCISPLGSGVDFEDFFRIWKKPCRFGEHFLYHFADMYCSSMIIFHMFTQAVTSKAYIVRISSLIILVFQSIVKYFGLVHIPRYKPFRSRFI